MIQPDVIYRNLKAVGYSEEFCRSVAYSRPATKVGGGREYAHGGTYRGSPVVGGKGRGGSYYKAQKLKSMSVQQTSFVEP